MVMDPTKVPENVAARSQDAMQATVHSGGQSNQFRFDFGDKAKTLLFALSIAINILCLAIIFYDRQEQRLKQYDLVSFKSDEFAPVRADVDLMKGEFSAFSTRLAIREECKK